jgi:hypothetical protein
MEDFSTDKNPVSFHWIVPLSLDAFSAALDHPLSNAYALTLPQIKVVVPKVSPTPTRSAYACEVQ